MDRMDDVTDSGGKWSVIREKSGESYTVKPVTDTQRLIWKRMMLSSGAIDQPWFDKLNRIRHERLF